jgi:hypothetical protein
MTSSAFWQTTPLADMSAEQWESLCDSCGRCCLHKLEDEDTGEVFYTEIACQLLDNNSRCSDYSNRLQRVPGCLSLSYNDIAQFHWLPATCAYRLLAEGKPLYDWHPLVSGSQSSVQQAGITVGGWAISEHDVAEEDFELHVIQWVD